MTGGVETVPFGPGDVRRVRATFPDISERQACCVLHVARSTLHRTAATRASSPKLAEDLVTKLHTLIQQHSTYGYRCLLALLRYREGVAVNRKTVYRTLRIKQWLVHQRTCTSRPRASRLRSRAPQSNHRWAMDVTHIPCEQDGWGHLTAVIDCHDRELIGDEFALRGRATEAERAIEAACLARVDLSASSVPSSLSGLSAATRIYHARYAGKEWLD